MQRQQALFTKVEEIDREDVVEGEIRRKTYEKRAEIDKRTEILNYTQHKNREREREGQGQGMREQSKVNDMVTLNGKEWNGCQEDSDVDMPREELVSRKKVETICSSPNPIELKIFFALYFSRQTKHVCPVTVLVMACIGDNFRRLRIQPIEK